MIKYEVWRIILGWNILKFNLINVIIKKRVRVIIYQNITYRITLPNCYFRYGIPFLLRQNYRWWYMLIINIVKLKSIYIRHTGLLLNIIFVSNIGVRYVLIYGQFFNKYTGWSNIFVFFLLFTWCITQASIYESTQFSHIFFDLIIKLLLLCKIPYSWPG